MVSIAHIFRVQFPVVGQNLGEAADDFQLLAGGHGAQPFAHFMANECFDIRGIV